ncbi:MAG: cell wall hydrolase, partial [Sphingomicrobium sp.]
MSANWDIRILVNLLGGRAASAIIGMFMLALGSSVASAQDVKAPLTVAAPLNVAAAVKALDTDASAKPLGPVALAATAVVQKVAAAAIALPTTAGLVAQAAQPARPLAGNPLGSSIEKEAPWLYRNGWPLYALVDRYATNAPLDEQTNCLATAVYFEARGESVDGQLAVAKVVMNRAASGRYPPSYCATV